jgi:Tol biopolymer transport system component
MMKQTTGSWRRIAEAILLGVIAIAMIALFRAVSGGGKLSPAGESGEINSGYPGPQILASGMSYPPPDRTPNPTPTPDGTGFPDPSGPTPLSTPTVPPMPTQIPTPVVTPVPLAKPPIIPLPTEGPVFPYQLVYREGEALYVYDSENKGGQFLLDVEADLSLYLNNEGPWGSPSPDGTRVALVLSTSAEPHQKGQPLPEYGIYLLDLATNQVQFLIEDGFDPVWSPDGTRLAYRGGTSGLWVVEVATGEAREIYKVDRERGHHVTDLDWSPDGKRLVFIDEVFRESASILEMDAEGSEPANVLLPWEGYTLSSPKWSPDGAQILFISIAGKSSSSNYFYNLWVMDSEGAGQIQLTYDLDITGKPYWSPDGNWIAFPGAMFYEEPEPLSDLWLIDNTGTELKRLTSNFTEQVSDINPVWSPDGKRIIFRKEQKEVWELSLVDGAQSLLPAVTSDFILLLK